MEKPNEIEPSVVFGAIYPFICDNTIEEIWINSPERIFVARKGMSELTNLILTAQDVRELIERTLMWSGRRLDLSHPFVDARLPDGSRLHVVIPEITAEHWAINIRKHIAQSLSLRQLASAGALSDEIAEFLTAAVRNGSNILVSGGTQAGKTTLLNALAGEIPYSHRVITIEEVFEIHPRLPDVIQLQTRSANLQGEGEINLRRLVKEALRMRPNRVIIGEVREAEALDLLIALNSGLPGMGTIHANSARDAVMKLQTLPLLAGANISHAFIVPTVASAIDLVIQVEMDFEGHRRVTEVVALNGRSEKSLIEMETLWKWEERAYVEGLALESFRSHMSRQPSLEPSES
ncbi:CpaF Flp pilus assembly protein, ATPase CpaF [Candidatus Nanopelagicaceae bacterium]